MCVFEIVSGLHPRIHFWLGPISDPREENQCQVRCFGDIQVGVSDETKYAVGKEPLAEFFRITAEHLFRLISGLVNYTHNLPVSTEQFTLLAHKRQDPA